MSMQTQIQRIKDAKEAMRLSIIAKGVDVPISAKIDTYPSYIAQIVRTTQRATFAVTDDITQYTSTEFVDVFDRATGKWYKLNDQNQFEPYGVYGTSPDDTKYVGKLIVYNGNEYEWTGSDWRYLGQVEGESHTSDFTTQDIGNVIQTDVSVLEDGMYLSILPYSLKGQTSNSKALLGSSSIDNLSNLFSYTNVETIADSDIIDRSVWKLYSTGVADTYYVQNVATGKYFGYETVTANYSLPLVDNANKVPVKFVVFTVNNVTAIGICKSGTPNDGYAINNLYSYNNRYNWFNTIAGASDLNNSFVIYKINSSSAVYPKEYAAIAIPTPPPAQVTFNTMQDAIGYSYVYYGLRATIDGSQYVYNSNNEWEELGYTLTGTKYGSDAMTLRINGNTVNAEILNAIDETTYNWGIDWDVSTPITNINSPDNTNIISIDWSKTDVSQWTYLDANGLLDTGAFQNCTRFNLTALPSAITVIGNKAFYNCTSLTLSELPASVEYVGDNVFYNCTSLTSMAMPNVKRIGSYAFKYCSSLASVSMPNIEQIDKEAFRGCTALALTELPSGVTSIGESAFYGCSSIALTELPSGVTSIGASAFYGCSSLTSVNIPSSVTSIVQTVFQGCTSLTTVSMPNVTSIGAGAFRNCYSLALTELPSSITSIGDRAFQSCSSLTTVSMPNVTSIGESAFQSCSSLTTVSMPNVTSIRKRAFYACSKLTSVTIEATTPPTIGSQPFDGTTNLSAIYVPAESVDAYKSASGWSAYADKIQAITE